jgi:hypothetical protein
LKMLTFVFRNTGIAESTNGWMCADNFMEQ